MLITQGRREIFLDEHKNSRGSKQNIQINENQEYLIIFAFKKPQCRMKKLIFYSTS